MTDPKIETKNLELCVRGENGLDIWRDVGVRDPLLNCRFISKKKRNSLKIYSILGRNSVVFCICFITKKFVTRTDVLFNSVLPKMYLCFNSDLLRTAYLILFITTTLLILMTMIRKKSHMPILII